MADLLERLEGLAREEGLPVPPDETDLPGEFPSLRALVEAVNPGLGPGESIEVSTVHFFRTLDLVSSPGRGRGSRWTRLQAREIRTVRLLQRKGLTLRAIRERLAGTGAAAASTPLDAAAAPFAAAPPAEAPRLPAGRFRPSPLEAIPLGPGVEILVRRPLSAREEWALGHLLEEAERLFRG